MRREDSLSYKKKVPAHGRAPAQEFPCKLSTSCRLVHLVAAMPGILEVYHVCRGLLVIASDCGSNSGNDAVSNGELAILGVESVRFMFAVLSTVRVVSGSAGVRPAQDINSTSLGIQDVHLSSRDEQAKDKPNPIKMRYPTLPMKWETRCRPSAMGRCTALYSKQRPR